MGPMVRVAFVGALSFLLAGFGPFVSDQTRTVAGANLVTQVLVIGKDERRSVPKKYDNIAGSVGAIWIPDAGKKGRAGMCTAFCVADRVIATNAHCVVRQGRRRLKNLDEIFFIRKPQFKQLQMSALISGSRLVVTSPDDPYLTFYTGFARGGGFLGKARHDWAFAKLEKPVCAGYELPFTKLSRKQLRRAAKKKQIFMIGLHGVPKGDSGLLYSPNCRPTLRKDGRSFKHFCDMTKGSSGSPLIWFDGKKAHAIAINLGHYAWSKGYRVINRRTGRERRKIVSSGKFNLAALPEHFVEGVKAFKEAELLSDADEFRLYQTLLKKAGYYRGKIDGKYGPQTRAATKKLEKFLERVPLGLPSKALLGDLRILTNIPDANSNKIGP